MSNFDTIDPFVGGIAGTAPVGFTASTEDDLAEITTAGYMNDLGAEKIVKKNDFIWINYLADDVELTNAILDKFRVTVVGPVFSLVAIA